jgi:hypothetical protein
MADKLRHCSQSGKAGWNHANTTDEGGWTGVCSILIRIPKGFDVIFSSLTLQKWTPLSTKSCIQGTLIGMARATPERFEFSIKVPRDKA